MVRAESTVNLSDLSDLDAQKIWVDEVLAEHRASQVQIEQLGLLKLSTGLKGLMWLLRLYVIFMVVVVIVNVFQQTH
ncbi:MAG: hypothetical protein M1600_10135 [Firmicutes bacterium]|jgi:hypothetical protein|nr:hypothetical protein [Bacillota bacterium]